MRSSFYRRFSALASFRARRHSFIGRNRGSNTEGSQIKLKLYRLARTEAEFWADAQRLGGCILKGWAEN